MSAMGNLVLEIQEQLENGDLIGTVANTISKEYKLPFWKALDMVNNIVEMMSIEKD